VLHQRESKRRAFTVNVETKKKKLFDWLKFENTYNSLWLPELKFHFACVGT
jgi:hypothetical protein